MIRVKEGVEFAVVAPGGLMILAALKIASKALDLNLTITSGTDGEHSGPDDPHHHGNAYDVRSHDIDPIVCPHVVDAVMQVLGRERFYGFIESPGTSDEHFHFQLRHGATCAVEDFLQV